MKLLGRHGFSDSKLSLKPAARQRVNNGTQGPIFAMTTQRRRVTTAHVSERYRERLANAQMKMDYGACVASNRADCHYVIVTELGDDFFHQNAARARARARLEVIELARDIARRAAGDSRNRAQPFQIRTVTDRRTVRFCPRRLFGPAPRLA